jgi:hypothetical protein
MSDSIELKKIKRNIYLYFTEDGLIDIALGVVIFCFGYLLMAGLPGLVGILGLVPLIFLYITKQAIVIPRAGSFQPSKTMKGRLRGFALSLLVAGTGGFIIFLFRNWSGSTAFSDFSLTIFGLIIALAICSLGLMLNTNRYYFYGVLVFFCMAVGEAFNREIWRGDLYLFLVMISGAIIFLLGIITLMRFLLKYPVVDQTD